jgi:putative ABC transport system permease protein
VNRTRVRIADVVPAALTGIRARPLRAGLSALGIAIGVACVVAVLGITASSQAELLVQIDRLGTNLLVVEYGHNVNGAEVPLPASATGTVSRVEGVTAVAPTSELPTVHVYRSDRIPAARIGALSVRVADARLLSTLDGSVASGRFLDPALADFPATVLGWQAAAQLGVSQPSRVWLGGHWFTVVGVLEPLPLAPEIDRSALIGFPVAASLFGYDGKPGRLYVRADIDRVTQVYDLLGASANPAAPHEVAVSRPSDALTLRAEAAGTLNGLFLGLGAVALLVGAIGIANVMVIGVLERRTEIGLRRALGAARVHVAAQFLAEAVVLAGLGALGGLAAGVAITAGVAAAHAWPFALSGGIALAGFGSALLIGGLAGVYPAARASRLSPTDALRAG